MGTSLKNYPLDFLSPLSAEASTELLLDEAFKRDCECRGVDAGMLVSNLRLTVAERWERLERMRETLDAFHKAGREAGLIQ